MEEATRVSSEVPLVMEKEEEDTTFDSGFIKVEKEGINTKYGNEKQESLKGSQRELLGSQENSKDLELELEKVTRELKWYESENTILKERLEETEKKLQEQNWSLEAALKVAMKKQKSVEERLEKQGKEIDEVTTRSIELEALHRHSESSLTEKSKDLEERIRLYEGKLAEAYGQSLSLKEELNQSSVENELLVDTNNQLKIKIQELVSEKDIANERLKSYENLIEEQKRQVLEASGVGDTRKVEFEDAILKLKSLESTIEELERQNGDLAEVNMNLNQKLANHGSVKKFQTKLFALEAEKDQTVKELQTVIEDLTKQLTSLRESLRLQISSLEEENKQVNEVYKISKNEIVKLQEQLQVEKSKSDAMVSDILNLSAVAAEKSALEEVETRMKETNLKLEATLNKSQEEVEEKRSMNVHLESQLKELQQKLQFAESISEQHKKNSDASSSGDITTQKSETSHLMTLKIIFGVALVSVITGIILGKRY